MTSAAFELEPKSTVLDLLPNLFKFLHLGMPHVLFTEDVHSALPGSTTHSLQDSGEIALPCWVFPPMLCFCSGASSAVLVTLSLEIFCLLLNDSQGGRIASLPVSTQLL